ncbi:MAG TPA: hypothetical protein PLD38_15675 [Pyrinomonadaceae bacterium]|nr:hypothetical protein [Pyrinomonadaceae bacterium]
MADTGWLNLTTFSTVGGLSFAWVNPSNASASDNTYATQPNSTSGLSDSLQGVGLVSSTVPSGATIDGIEVRIEAKKSSNVRAITFDLVQLVIAGTPSGSNLGSGAITTTETVYAFGGATSLWGLTPSEADVNGGSFGVIMRFVRGAGKSGTTQSVDQIQMKIYYTAGGGPSFIAKSNARPIQAVRRASSY